MEVPEKHMNGHVNAVYGPIVFTVTSLQLSTEGSCLGNSFNLHLQTMYYAT